MLLLKSAVMKTSLIFPLKTRFFKVMLVADGGWGMFPISVKLFA